MEPNIAWHKTARPFRTSMFMLQKYAPDHFCRQTLSWLIAGFYYSGLGAFWDRAGGWNCLGVISVVLKLQIHACKLFIEGFHPCKLPPKWAWDCQVTKLLEFWDVLRNFKLYFFYYWFMRGKGNYFSKMKSILFLKLFWHSMRKQLF